MNKNGVIDTIKRMLLASLGLFIFGFAVHCAIRANIGVGPWDVFCIGLSNTLGIKYGTASIAISVVLIIIDVLMGEKIGFGTILDAIIVGKTVDFFNWLDVIPIIEDNLILSIAIMLVAFLFEGFSQYMYMKAGLSCGPRDSFQIALGKRMPKIPIGYVNIILLAVVLVIGFLLHGPIGIGTVLAAFGLGIAQEIAFNVAKFDPKAVTHQSVVDTINILIRKS